MRTIDFNNGQTLRPRAVALAACKARNELLNKISIIGLLASLAMFAYATW